MPRWMRSARSWLKPRLLRHGIAGYRLPRTRLGHQSASTHGSRCSLGSCEHGSAHGSNAAFSERVGERFLVYTKDLRKDGATTLLPVMMTMLV